MYRYLLIIHFFLIISNCLPYIDTKINKLSDTDISTSIHIIYLNPGNEKTIVPTKKIIIKFNDSINPSTIKLNGTMASDSDGGELTNDACENDTLTISPLSNWSNGSQTLTLECKSVNGDTLPVMLNLTYNVDPSADDIDYLDDFDDGDNTNLWEGKMGVMGNGVSEGFSSTDAMPGSIYALELSYSLSAGFWGGYWIMLGDPPDVTPVDISIYEYLTFWIKGSAGNEPLKIEIENLSAEPRNIAHLYVADYIDGGVTTEWKEVRIPLDAFCNLDGLDNALQMNLIIEYDYANLSGFPTASTIYLEDFGFSKNPLDFVRIDHFGDNCGLNALGANMGGMGGGTGYSMTTTYDETVYHSFSRSLKAVYNTGATGWCGVWFLIGRYGTAVECDFSDYSKLTLWVRGETVGETPAKLKVELVDSVGSKVAYIPDNTLEGTAISTSWQKYTIPLINFIGLDITTIKQFNFIFESATVVNNSGIAYFDEIQFEK